MKLKGTNEDTKIFEINIIYRGKCLNNNKVFTNEDFQKFLEIQSIKFLWTYVREIVSYLMGNMGLMLQPLPTIDVLNILKKSIDIGEIKKMRQRNNIDFEVLDRVDISLQKAGKRIVKFVI